jgi:hypothetical protein
LVEQINAKAESTSRMVVETVLLCEQGKKAIKGREASKGNMTIVRTIVGTIVTPNGHNRL